MRYTTQNFSSVFINVKTSSLFLYNFDSFWGLQISTGLMHWNRNLEMMSDFMSTWEKIPQKCQIFNFKSMRLERLVGWTGWQSSRAQLLLLRQLYFNLVPPIWCVEKEHLEVLNSFLRARVGCCKYACKFHGENDLYRLPNFYFEIMNLKLLVGLTGWQGRMACYAVWGESGACTSQTARCVSKVLK